MKTKRVVELSLTAISLPVVLVVAALLGIGSGFFLWRARMRLLWQMRNSTFVWEDKE